MSIARMSPAAQRKWSTPRWLWTAMAAAVGLALAFWVCATGVLFGGQSAVGSVEDRGVPAFVSARIAHAALSDADRAVWQSFRTGAAQLIGPGQRFRDDLTTAADNLARIAELDLGGGAGRDALQAVNAQVVTYQGLVEQADASYREGLVPLGLAYLGYASDLLRRSDGLLVSIENIAAYGEDAAHGWRHSAWAGSAAALTTVGLGVALLAVLVHIQVAMARRFRRLLNVPLLAASAVLAGLLVWTTATFFQVDHSLSTAYDTRLPALDRTLESQIVTADTGAKALRDNRSAGEAGGLNVAAAETAQEPLKDELADASDTGGLMAGLPLLTLAVAGLAASGVWFRLREFWR
ncbi:hypothetical protein [Actinomadura rubrisoli]|uniref:Uncharacterized protein n=1 Tax=Actinomadura rubrisoli TaxID=2530368 RepID=A0A4R5BDW1_9ACTN|nr:hypothetical protein [Actinomadura rubrisoli]TDD84421.1 hypothetical protein E1298_20020 [Actinomadura rubrisoli]